MKPARTNNWWLAYVFSGSYGACWMDRANGYSFTPIQSPTHGYYFLDTAYASTIWFQSLDGAYHLGFQYSAPTGQAWVVYGTSQTNIDRWYQPWDNWWYQKNSGGLFDPWEKGGPDLHRP